MRSGFPYCFDTVGWVGKIHRQNEQDVKVWLIKSYIYKGKGRGHLPPTHLSTNGMPLPSQPTLVLICVGKMTNNELSWKAHQTLDWVLETVYNMGSTQ